MEAPAGSVGHAQAVRHEKRRVPGRATCAARWPWCPGLLAAPAPYDALRGEHQWTAAAANAALLPPQVPNMNFTMIHSMRVNYHRHTSSAVISSSAVHGHSAMWHIVTVHGEGAPVAACPTPQSGLGTCCCKGSAVARPPGSDDPPPL